MTMPWQNRIMNKYQSSEDKPQHRILSNTNHIQNRGGMVSDAPYWVKYIAGGTKMYTFNDCFELCRCEER